MKYLLALFVFAIVYACSWCAVRLGAKKQPAPPPRVTFVPEAPEGSVPRYGSRRWARALFHNGLIDISELNAFYMSHPENLSDPDR